VAGETAWKLAKLGLLLGVIGFVWERISTMLFAFLAPNIAPDLLALLAEVHLSTDHRDLLLIWILTGGTLALIVFAITVVSVPLLLDRKTDFITAMRTSLRTVDANLLVMILWGAIVVTLTAIGFLTLFFGLIVSHAADRPRFMARLSRPCRIGAKPCFALLKPRTPR
jgi:uncharacterized membrane protein